MNNSGKIFFVKEKKGGFLLKNPPFLVLIAKKIYSFVRISSNICRSVEGVRSRVIVLL